METMLFTVAMVAYLIAFLAQAGTASLDRPQFYPAGRVALAVGALVATGALLLRTRAAGHPPLTNMYESLVTLSTFLAWTALAFTRTVPMPLLEGGSAVFSVLLFGIASLFSADARPLIPALQSYWLHLHVSVAFVGEACFALSFLLSYLFCFRRVVEVPERASGLPPSAFPERSSREALPPAGRAEKAVCLLTIIGLPLGFLALVGLAMTRLPAEAPWRGALLWGIIPVLLVLVVLAMLAYRYRGAVGTAAEKHLPSASTLDEYMYRAIAFGYPLFTVGALIFGMVWANKAWGRYWGWDPKETWALITFLVYSIYLHVRLTRGWQGTWTALLSIIGFLVTLFTLFGVNLVLSGLHSYAAN